MRLRVWGLWDLEWLGISINYHEKRNVILFLQPLMWPSITFQWNLWEILKKCNLLRQIFFLWPDYNHFDFDGYRKKNTLHNFWIKAHLIQVKEPEQSKCNQITFGENRNNCVHDKRIKRRLTTQNIWFTPLLNRFRPILFWTFVPNKRALEISRRNLFFLSAIPFYWGV